MFAYPGPRVRHLMNKRKLHPPAVAAAMAGMGVRTARRIARGACLPSQEPPRSWRTRSDSFADVGDSEGVALLRSHPGRQAVMWRAIRFLPYALDLRMSRNVPVIGFERYADEVVILRERLARPTMLRHARAQRLAIRTLNASGQDEECRLQARDTNGRRPRDSLELTRFRVSTRNSEGQAGVRLGFLPALRGGTATAIRQTEPNWHLQRPTRFTPETIACRIAPPCCVLVRHTPLVFTRRSSIRRWRRMPPVKGTARKSQRARRSLARTCEGRAPVSA